VAVDVFEADNCVGGLAKTAKENGYCLDVGPHSFFSEDDRIIKTVLDLFDYTLEPMPRTVKFFYKDKYLNYPLTPQGVLLQMGLFSGVRVALSYLKGKIFPRRSATLGTAEETVEDWAIASFGEHLYRTFFKQYTEQFWKVPCSELSSRSIPTHTRMSFLNTLRVLLHRRATKTGESLIERETLPTYYPGTGFGEIAERVADTIKRCGGNVHLNCKVVGVSELPDGQVCVTYERNGKSEKINADYVISTIQLPLLVKMLSPQPPAEVLTSAGKLDFRSLVVLGMATEKQKVLGCGYIYLLDRPYNRISEMNEFSTQTSPQGENIIAVEIPCLYNSAAWKASKEELFDMCISSLAEDGFLGPGDVEKLFLVKAPAAYPIYRKDYAKHFERLLNYLKARRSIATLGRCGEFMYMDIDICMRRAFDFADNLLRKF
jgi:protoporphyrinogen oxidase